MEYLLECIGFPPGTAEKDLIARILREGEPTLTLDPGEERRRLDLSGGLELRADCDPRSGVWTLFPHFRVPHRLRLAVMSVAHRDASPFDALLTGWACPPLPGELEPIAQPGAPGVFRLATWLTDARDLPRLEAGQVIAVSIAGFALDVTLVAPNDEASHPAILERPHGAYVRPLQAPDSPAGCSDVSLRIRSIRHLRNRLTGRPVDLLICDAPERPLLLFVNPWQLEQDELPAPRPGWRIEGTFLFSGRAASVRRARNREAQRAFG